MTSAVFSILRILLVAMRFSQFQLLRLQPSSRVMLHNFKGSRRWQTRETASATLLEKDSDRLPRIPIILHIYVEREILVYLNMKNHQRKTRISLPRYSTDGLLFTYSESSVRDIVEKTLPSLTNEPYKLRYQLVDNESDKMKNQLKLKDIGSLSSSQLSSLMQVTKSLQLYVQSAPGAFPPSSDTYYEGMSDPLCTETFTMVSFYKFQRIQDTAEFAKTLEKLWKPFFALGRVYVASEGVNAQMAIPTNVIKNFEKATQSLSMFESLRLNTDHLVSTEEFAATRPFKALHVRVREQIVTDGFADLSSAKSESQVRQLDWDRSGKEMSPLDWHEQLDDPNTIILDCRNSYESDVGVFDNAIPLNTTFFRESWTALDSILKDKPKDTKLMTYCTGGIRCVKINAYLEQRLGFRNVHRLQGGIIAYARELESQSKTSSHITEDEVTLVAPSLPSSKDERNIAESRFKGVNYVFDERIGSRITDHVLTSCELCGKKCDSYSNCQNGPCNVRFIQCASCQDSYSSCCSKVCQSERDSIAANEVKLSNKQMLSRQPVVRPQPAIAANENEEGSDSSLPSTADAVQRSTLVQKKEHAINSDALLEALSQYSERYSFPEPELLGRLREQTKALFDPLAYRMVSGVLQGRLLSMLVTLTKAKRVLELGTFTGYSALSFADGMMANAATDSGGGGAGRVVTCEIDDKAAEIAQKFFSESAYSDMVMITLERAPAMSLLSRLRVDGAMFDIVFIDADKKKYLDYVKFIIGDEVEGDRGRPILNPNGLIIIDNTLWKGLVLLQDAEIKSEAIAQIVPESYGNAHRMTAIAEHMHALNSYLAGNPPSLEPVMLPFRDGLTIVRYKGR